MITQAIEDYLKIIYKLSSGQNNKSVSTNAVAECMSVTQASVTGMMKKLFDLNLIDYKRYHGVTLTEAGEKIALEILRHHRLLELYLAEALGFSWDKVHAEAEKLEHHISEEFEEKIAELLGHPLFDPHGAPIPTKDGFVPKRNLQTLTLAAVGSTVFVQQVIDEEPEVLRYLGNLGVYPGCEIKVLGKAPFSGPLKIQIAGAEYHLGEKLTNQIFIEAT